MLSEDGAVVGVYSNGKSLPLYRVAIAVFSDPEELIKRVQTCMPPFQHQP